MFQILLRKQTAKKNFLLRGNTDITYQREKDKENVR